MKRCHDECGKMDLDTLTKIGKISYTGSNKNITFWLSSYKHNISEDYIISINNYLGKIFPIFQTMLEGKMKNIKNNMLHLTMEMYMDNTFVGSNPLVGIKYNTTHSSAILNPILDVFICINYSNKYLLFSKLEKQLKWTSYDNNNNKENVSNDDIKVIIDIFTDTFKECQNMFLTESQDEFSTIYDDFIKYRFRSFVDDDQIEINFIPAIKLSYGNMVVFIKASDNNYKCETIHSLTLKNPLIYHRGACEITKMIKLIIKQQWNNMNNNANISGHLIESAVMGIEKTTKIDVWNESSAIELISFCFQFIYSKLNENPSKFLLPLNEFPTDLLAPFRHSPTIMNLFLKQWILPTSYNSVDIERMETKLNNIIYISETSAKTTVPPSISTDASINKYEHEVSCIICLTTENVIWNCLHGENTHAVLCKECGESDIGKKYIKTEKICPICRQLIERFIRLL